MKNSNFCYYFDISKGKLDIYVPPQGGGRAETKQLDNGVAGFRTLRDLARKAKATVCVEPTGGYELELIAFMYKFGVAVAYADVLRVRFRGFRDELVRNDVDNLTDNPPSRCSAYHSGVRRKWLYSFHVKRMRSLTFVRAIT